MILPPDSDKEREALADLLTSPPIARLHPLPPPPPYGDNSLYRSASITADIEIPYRLQPSVETLSLDVGSITGSLAESNRRSRRRRRRRRWSGGDEESVLDDATSIRQTSIETERPIILTVNSTSPASTIGSASRLQNRQEKKERDGYFQFGRNNNNKFRWIITTWGSRGKTSRHPRWWSRRTWVIVCITAACMIIIAGTIGGIFGGLRLARSFHPTRPPSHLQKQVLPWYDGKVVYDPFRDGPPSSDGTPIQCNIFTPLPINDVLRSITFSPQGQNQSVSSFTLPMTNVSQQSNSTAEIFVNAYGDSVGGSIEVLGAQDTLLSESIAGGAGPGQVKVDVVMKQGVNASRALVCSMRKDDGSVGVGVYTNVLVHQPPDVLVAPNPSLSFLIVIRFPPSSSITSPSYINNFRLESSIMGISMGDMRGIVEFGNFTGKVGRGGISATHLVAAQTTLDTNMSTLSGTFNVSESLDLMTSDGGLLVQAILHNPNLPFNPFNTTTLTQTPLGFFGAFTQPRHLLASDDPVKRDTNAASFDIDNVPLQTIRVNAVTTNGPLSIFYHQDPGVRLFSKCSTTNGLVFVQHDPSWQGSFLVRSLNGLMRVPDITSLSAQQTSVSTPADPWGLNRQQAIGFSHGSSEPYYLNGTLLSDPGVQYGISRGDAVFNDLIQSWEVSGMVYWLDSNEVSSGVNVSALADNIAQTCNGTCTGVEFLRSSFSTVATSWGDATLCLARQQN